MRKIRYSPEVRRRAVHMVFEHERDYTSQWATIQSIAPAAYQMTEDWLYT